MKRTFRVAIILIPVVVLLVGIGLWRHHYLKIMNAEPVKVYKVTLVKGDDNTDVTDVTDVTDIEPNITTQRIDNSITPEEMYNTSNSPAGTIFGDIAEQNLPPEAAAALKQYAEIQPAQAALNDELRPLLKASPLDWDAIGLITEKKEKLHQQRKDALEILALYSDEAFNELQATIAREKEAERIVAELDGESLASRKARLASLEARLASTEARSASRKASAASRDASAASRDASAASTEASAAKIKKAMDVAEEIAKSIPTMSREELEQAREELEQAREEFKQASE